MPEQTEAMEKIGLAWRQIRRQSNSKTFRDLVYGQGPTALDALQADMLTRLTGEKTWRMGDLANALSIDASTATRTADKLVRARLAVRYPAQNDGRGVLISATQLGFERIADIQEKRMDILTSMLSHWNEDDIARFAVLFSRAAEDIEDTVIPCPASCSAG